VGRQGHTIAMIDRTRLGASMNPQEARSDADIEERFFLSGRTEIAFALDDLIHRGERVTVSFNRSMTPD
jgi:hypothetical protein